MERMPLSSRPPPTTPATVAAAVPRNELPPPIMPPPIGAPGGYPACGYPACGYPACGYPACGGGWLASGRGPHTPLEPCPPGRTDGTEDRGWARPKISLLILASQIPQVSGAAGA